MLEIETITVKLGEREYEIRQAGFRRSKPWKKRLLEEVKPLFEQVAGAQDMQFETPADLLKLLPVAESLFVDGIETIGELLIAYAPELETDREYIEEYATDKQVFQAFQEVLYLADFFGAIQLVNRQIGQMPTGTSSKLPLQNGDLHQSVPEGSQTTK